MEDMDDIPVNNQTGATIGVVRTIAALILTAVTQMSALGYPCQDASPLGRLSFLLGEWVGQPKGKPDYRGFPGVKRSGDVTAHFELNKWVLILKSRTTYEDMMIAYAGCGSAQAIGALYIDGTAHTVQHFTWKVRSKPNGVTFEALEALGQGGLPVRLTYAEVADGNISIEFESGGLTYTSTARRRAP
jgi:hypothetical protein